jgi:nicotinamide mononucleotide (NMN) deamidase PncC
MVLESVMLVNVKLVTYNKQAKQRALSASISVLSAVPMISESVWNVEELVSKTLQVSV